jgi:hypothetical protein
MQFSLRGSGAFLMTFLALLRASACAMAGDADTTDQLNLADLVNYRAALTGKATADDARSSDPAVRVAFKDLWHRPEVFRGRRVMVEGRIQRIFRQGPVGDFPALAEIWIASATGDPFCLVIPLKTDAFGVSSHIQNAGAEAATKELPRLGQSVRFTGIYLKMVRYAADDADRLAPLVVGNQPPVYVRGGLKTANANSVPTNNPGSDWNTWAGSWPLILIVTLLVTGTLVIRHSRLVSQQLERRQRQQRATASLGADPPLEFVDTHTQS